MTFQSEWLLTKTAPTADALADGDGCHHDEAEVLGKYFEGACSVQDTAKNITQPIMQEQDPMASIGRLWSLLCEASVELSDQHRDKTMDLLSTIQTLPPSAQIEWSQLPQFGHMWSDLYRLHLHGTDAWEKQSLTDDRADELRKHFGAIGTAEAEMYARHFPGMGHDWGYDVLNLICSRRPGLDILLNEVCAWLKVAATKLKESMDQEEIRSYPRPVIGGRPGEQQAVRDSMGKHWTTWTRELSELAKDGSILSAQGRRLATECHALMQ